MGKRSITDEEIGLIKAMLHFGMKNKNIQFYFNRQDRAVNSGRITQIKDGTYGPEVQPSAAAVLQAFMASFSAPQISAVPINVNDGPIASIDPISDAYLQSLFTKDENDGWVCSVGESDQHECKTGFNFKRFGKALRAIAGFANNKGGYIFFGVMDKPERYKVCGLEDARFETVDISSFSQVIRSSLEPTPDFAVKSIKVGSANVGVIYVKPHPSKPVIARKTEGELVEGVIYFRYPGESRAISYPDLRALLDERDRQSRYDIIPMVERVLELGPKNALVANLADGTLEGGTRPILMDESLLNQIKFIREGHFVERQGAEALRVVGDVNVVPEGTVQPTKTVREEITEISIIRNFVRANVVAHPMAYFRQASHEQSWLLPIFYYLFLAGISRAIAIADLIEYSNAKPKTREEIINRLQGQRTQFVKAGPKRHIALANLRNKQVEDFDDIADAKSTCYVMTSLEASDEPIFSYARGLLSKAIALWEQDISDRSFLSIIRYAACRLDELEYAGRVVTD